MHGSPGSATSDAVSQKSRTTTRVKPDPGSLPSPCQNEYVRVVTEDLRLAGVLETVLYYASDQQDDMERFYEHVLGLVSLGLGRWSRAGLGDPGVPARRVG